MAGPPSRAVRRTTKKGLVLVYLGMPLGGLPRSLLDSAGVVMIGCELLVAAGAVESGQDRRAVDIAILALLFGLTVPFGAFAVGPRCYASLAPRRARAGAAAAAGNVIVVDQAGLGLPIGWRDPVGARLPITLLALVLAAPRWGASTLATGDPVGDPG